MSCDLDVKISEPIDKQRLLHDCKQVFSGLLNIASHFEFAFFSDSYIGPKLLNHNVYFDILEVEAQLPWISVEEAGSYAFAEAGGIWPFGYVVAASVIIAVARQSNGFIRDTATRWIKPEDKHMVDDGYDADRFFQVLRNPQVSETVEEAVMAFDERLPVHFKL